VLFIAMFKPIESVYLSPKTSIQVQTNNTNKDSLDDLILKHFKSYQNEMSEKYDKIVNELNEYKQKYEDLKKSCSKKIK